MAKKRLQALLSYTTRPGCHAKYKFRKNQLIAVTADLKELIRLESAGQVLPSRSRIAKYLYDEHGVRISPTTVGAWLEKIRMGEPIA